MSTRQLRTIGFAVVKSELILTYAEWPSPVYIRIPASFALWLRARLREYAETFIEAGVSQPFTIYDTPSGWQIDLK